MISPWLPLKLYYHKETKTFTDYIISSLQPELLFLDINVALCFPLEKCTMQHKYTSNLYQKHLRD